MPKDLNIDITITGNVSQFRDALKQAQQSLKGFSDNLRRELQNTGMSSSMEESISGPVKKAREQIRREMDKIKNILAEYSDTTKIGKTKVFNEEHFKRIEASLRRINMLSKEAMAPRATPINISAPVLKGFEGFVSPVATKGSFDKTKQELANLETSYGLFKAKTAEWASFTIAETAAVERAFKVKMAGARDALAGTTANMDKLRKEMRETVQPSSTPFSGPRSPLMTFGGGKIDAKGTVDNIKSISREYTNLQKEYRVFQSGGGAWGSLTKDEIKAQSMRFKTAMAMMKDGMTGTSHEMDKLRNSMRKTFSVESFKGLLEWQAQWYLGKAAVFAAWEIPAGIIKHGVEFEIMIDNWTAKMQRWEATSGKVSAAYKSSIKELIIDTRRAALDIPISFDKIAESVESFISAGVDINVVRQLVPDIAKLKAAFPEIDMKQFGVAITGAFNAFKGNMPEITNDADKMRKIIEQLLAAQAKGVIRPEQFAVVIQHLGEMSRIAGFTTEEMFAMAVTITDMGSRAGNAARSLRGMMDQLVKPKTAKVLDEIGVKLNKNMSLAEQFIKPFKLDTGQEMKSILDQLANIVGTGAGKDIGALTILSKLFPVERMKSATALIDFSAELQKTLDFIKSSQGAIDAANQVMVESVGGQLEILKNRWNELTFSISGSNGIFKDTVILLNDLLLGSLMAVGDETVTFGKRVEELGTAGWLAYESFAALRDLYQEIAGDLGSFINLYTGVGELFDKVNLSIDTGYLKFSDLMIAFAWNSNPAGPIFRVITLINDIVTAFNNFELSIQGVMNTLEGLIRALARFVLPAGLVKLMDLYDKREIESGDKAGNQAVVKRAGAYRRSKLADKDEIANQLWAETAERDALQQRIQTEKFSDRELATAQKNLAILQRGIDLKKGDLALISKKEASENLKKKGTWGDIKDKDKTGSGAFTKGITAEETAFKNSLKEIDNAYKKAHNELLIEKASFGISQSEYDDKEAELLEKSLEDKLKKYDVFLAEFEPGGSIANKFAKARGAAKTEQERENLEQQEINERTKIEEAKIGIIEQYLTKIIARVESHNKKIIELVKKEAENELAIFKAVQDAKAWAVDENIKKQTNARNRGRISAKQMYQEETFAANSKYNRTVDLAEKELEQFYLDASLKNQSQEEFNAAEQAAIIKHNTDIEKAEREHTSTMLEMQRKMQEDLLLMWENNDLYAITKKAMEDLGKQYENMGKSIYDYIQSCAEGFRSTVEDGIFDFLEGKLSSFEDYFDAFMSSINRALAKGLSDMLMNYLFTTKQMEGAPGTGGSTGGILGGIISLFTGGGGVTGTGASDAGYSMIAGSGGSLLDWMPNFSHNGGLVLHGGGLVRPVLRHTGGPMYNEVDTRLLKGEYVVSRGGVNALDKINKGDLSDFNREQSITHNHYHINAMDSASFLQFAYKNKRTFANTMTAAKQENHRYRRTK